MAAKVQQAGCEHKSMDPGRGCERPECCGVAGAERKKILWALDVILLEIE